MSWACCGVASNSWTDGMGHPTCPGGRQVVDNPIHLWGRWMTHPICPGIGWVIQLHPPAPLGSVYGHLSFLAHPCGGQGPHDQCPHGTCSHGIGPCVQGLPCACHDMDIDRDPDCISKMAGGLLFMLFIQQGLWVNTRTYLHILINLTIWLEDKGDSPTTTWCWCWAHVGCAQMGIIYQQL